MLRENYARRLILFNLFACQYKFPDPTLFNVKIIMLFSGYEPIFTKCRICLIFRLSMKTSQRDIGIESSHIPNSEEKFIERWKSLLLYHTPLTMTTKLGLILLTINGF